MGALKAGRPAFGIFAPERSARGGAEAGARADIDFVFYDLEEATWDMDALEAFVTALWETVVDRAAPTVLLRIPPPGPDPAAAVRRALEGVARGAGGIILPRVESPDELTPVVEALKPSLWPQQPAGDLVLVAQIETGEAVGRASSIVGVPGVGVGLPGQKDLRRSYEGDEEAVQGAVLEVLAACRGAGIACGVTAGPSDVGRRLEEGFRFVIATPPAAVAAGRAWMDQQT